MRHVIIASTLLLAACGGGAGGNNSSDQAGQAIEQTPSNLQEDPNNQVVPITTPTMSPGASPTPIATLPAAMQGR